MRSADAASEHQKEKRSVDHFAGLDVSVKYTGVCVVDSMGFGSFKVASEPDAQLRAASGNGDSQLDLPVRYDGHPWVPRRQYNDVGRNFRPLHQGLRPLPNLALAGEIGGAVCRAAAPSPPFRPWFRRIQDRRSRRPSAAARSPSPSRNQPSNWWPRAHRSANKIIDTTSEPCVVLGSFRYLQSATANAKEHAIASVLDGPLCLGQPLFAADQARWSCA